MTFIRHLFEALLNPYFIILLTLGFLIARGYRTLLLWVILFILSTGWMVEALTHMLEKQYPFVSKVDPSIQWVVVLSGGQANETSLPPGMLLSGVSLKRLIEGMRLVRQLPDARLVLSGGGYNGDVPEADNLASIADWFAIDKNKMILESHSENTTAQVTALKKIVGANPFYLVTSAIHMPRSMRLCREQGLSPIAAPTDFTLYWQDERWEKTVIPNPQNLVYLSIAWHEILGLAWHRISGG